MSNKESKVSELTVEDITDISARLPNESEQNMLNVLAGMDTLIQIPEALALYRLCQKLPDNSKILEIGSYQGSSTVAMGHAIKGKSIQIYCIDLWADYLNQDDFVDFERSRISDEKKIIGNFIDNTSFLGDQIKMMRGDSKDFGEMIAGQNFDLIFIDGCHDYESIRADIVMCMAALKPGGLLTGHDFHSMGHGVRQAVNELIGIAPSINVKNVIKETYIWFARIENPGYELALLEISRIHNAGDVTGALNLAMATMQIYKTEELLNITNILKNAL